ncbi:hypothetical protein DFR24_3459 [Panacagrimonas perspica]|uniref:Uncharacterized protein n=1 Tax=Panacagrimonas perspica TaxID=381431 RepID=A0A4R7NYM3_9GAMM|nr:hypothetical protein DFR24_3459 [Panacagrimonas perspica]
MSGMPKTGRGFSSIVEAVLILRVNCEDRAWAAERAARRGS